MSEPLELTEELELESSQSYEASEWVETRNVAQGAGGRAVLGWTLSILAALWVGFTAWSAGRMSLFAVSKFSFSKVNVDGVAPVPPR